MARLQRIDPLETGGYAGHGEKTENLVDAAPVRASGNEAGCQQGLDFRGEQEPVAVARGAAGPVQGANPKTIASENQAAPLLVKAGKGELAVQVLEYALLVIFPEVRDQLGVAVSRKAVPLRFELAFGFRIVEEFAVEDGDHGPIFV